MGNGTSTTTEETEDSSTGGRFRPQQEGRPSLVRSDSLEVGRVCACGPHCRCANGWTSCNCGNNCQCANSGLSGEAELVLECLGIEEMQKSICQGIDPLTAAPLPTTTTTTTTTTTGKTTTKVIEMVVSGMTCTMCSQTIVRAVQNLKHVTDVSVSLSTDIVRVETNADVRLDQMREKIQNTIEAIGYDVEEILPPQQSVVVAGADLESSSEGPLSPSAADGGAPGEGGNYEEEDPQERWNRIHERQAQKLRERKQAFLWSLLGTLPILVVTMILPHFSQVHPNNLFSIHFGNNTVISGEALVLWMLATPVQFVCGYEFYKMAYFGIYVVGMLGMDVLVAMGTTASYGYALYSILFPSCSSSTSSDTGSDNDDGGQGCFASDEAHFFETSAVLISFVLLGKWMQALAVRRTSQALTGLLKLQPTTAIRILPESNDIENDNNPLLSWNPLHDPYREEEVLTKEIVPGDIVKIVKGASIPADGIVAFGEISVDESMVTGESLPILKTRGSAVLGATVCVESGVSEAPESLFDGSSPEKAVGNTNNHEEDGKEQQRLGIAFCKVTGVGSSTALCQIIQLVQDAQGRHVPIQSFADKVSSVFVPVVVGTSIVTFLVWYALCCSQVIPTSWLGDDDPMTFSLMFAIACLVISCPCALGLATPTAVMVGTGVGAQVGVLIKGGDVLEEASKVDTVVFDKTGTLTTGNPVVMDFELHNDSSQDFFNNNNKHGTDMNMETLFWLIGSLERSSEHPLAKAVVTYAEEQLGIDYLKNKPFAQPLEFRAVTGRGALGYVPIPGSRKSSSAPMVAVGNRAFATLMDIPIPSKIDVAMRRLERDGKTAILVVVNQHIVAVMGLMDELRPDAADSISFLKNTMGIDVWMVTGDNARTAGAIARRLCLDPQKVVSEALPSAKVQQVTKLQQEGRIVAMVGDGVNDSPALAKADVGLSIGTGAAIAAEASDMVLVKGQNVADVCTALDLSRVIFRRIQWNFLWSLIYNCLGIPIAAGVLYPLFHTRLPPTVAALAMALSSISVVFSSLALRLYRPKQVSSAEYTQRTINQPAMEDRSVNSLGQPLLSNLEVV